MSNLRDNTTYDMLNEVRIREAIEPLGKYCKYIFQDPATFLNLYLPLRLHPMTRSAINSIIVRHKPSKKQEDPEKIDFSVLTDTTPPGDEKSAPKEEVNQNEMYYYGLLMLRHTVVSIFKNNQDIAVTPADVNTIINYSHTFSNSQKKSFFQEICLPGMTEDFQLPVFFCFDQTKDKNLKIVYVCEE